LDRVENYDEATAVYKCRICGTNHFTTDVDAIKRYHNVRILNAKNFPIVNTSELERVYVYGQYVTIQLETITEHYYLVYVNGNEIFPDEFYSGDDGYTYYSFPMPNEDVTVVIEDRWVDIPEPSIEVTETLAPETTAPETTAPETTAPETTAPETTAPETTAPETTAPETTAPEIESGYEAGFRMLRYRWDGYGISIKEIFTCDLGYDILDRLSGLAETDRTVPKISDDKVTEFSGELPVTPGTVWLECGTVGLFRLNPEMNEIVRVETHLGEGRVLQMTDELKELLRQAWYYYPYDFWSGSYEKGEVTLKRVYRADSAIESVEIADISIVSENDSKNKIVVKFTAAESKSVTAWFQSYQSDDNIGGFDLQAVELVAGETTVLEFIFDGFTGITYWLQITVDNTNIDLRIDPR
jgi:hypothetical protein